MIASHTVVKVWQNFLVGTVNLLRKQCVWAYLCPDLWGDRASKFCMQYPFLLIWNVTIWMLHNPEANIDCDLAISSSGWYRGSVTAVSQNQDIKNFRVCSSYCNKYNEYLNNRLEDDSSSTTIYKITMNERMYYDLRSWNGNL